MYLYFKSIDSFHPDRISAAEATLEVLEDMKSKFHISPQDYLTVCTPLKELVGIFSSVPFKFV